MSPPKRITDPSFKYTKSDETDLRKTFARVRQQMAAQKKPKPTGKAAT